jgi:hypothetical protein
MHYDEDQRADLASLLALINTCTRLCVITRQPSDDYQRGQFG